MKKELPDYFNERQLLDLIRKCSCGEEEAYVQLLRRLALTFLHSVKSRTSEILVLNYLEHSCERFIERRNNGVNYLLVMPEAKKGERYFLNYLKLDYLIFFNKHLCKKQNCSQCIALYHRKEEISLLIRETYAQYVCKEVDGQEVVKSKNAQSVSEKLGERLPTEAELGMPMEQKHFQLYLQIHQKLNKNIKIL